MLLDDYARTVLGRLSAVLAGVSDWSPATLEAAIKEFAKAEGEKLGKIAQPLRAALTGKAASPGIFDVLALLGRGESLARIADQAAA